MIETTVLIAAISLFFIFCILLLVGIIGWDFVRSLLRKRCGVITAVVLAVLFVSLVFAYLLMNLGVIEPDRWVELSLIAGLVGATFVYALLTFRMVEEMREQRLTASQPLVFPDFAQARFPDPGEIWFINSGSGPALHLEIKVAYSGPEIVKRAWIERTGQYGSLAGVPNASRSILKAGDDAICRPELAEYSPGNVGTAFVEYSDIYGRCFLAGYGYRCNKNSNGGITLQPTEPIYPLVRERGD